MLVLSLIYIKVLKPGRLARQQHDRRNPTPSSPFAGRWIMIAGLAIFLVWTLAPIVWMVLTSFLFHRALIPPARTPSPRLFTLKNINGLSRIERC